MNPRKACLWLGVVAAVVSSVFFLTRTRDTATREQAIDVVRNVRSGKGNMDQQVAWLCRLLDGKSSGGIPFAAHECQWQATKVGPFLWRVEYEDRGVSMDGAPTASDKIWLLDTKSMELQPRTITTLMLTAPELAGVSSNKEINERFITLTGKPFEAHAEAMNDEIETLPRWWIGPDGVLSRR